MHKGRVLWALAGILVSVPALADFKPDSSQLIKDLEVLSKAEDRFTMVMWLPSEFWRAQVESNGSIPAKLVDQFMKEIDPYIVIAVADGQMGIAGSVTFTEPDSLKGSVTIEDRHGKRIAPIPDDQVSGGVKNLTQIMRPVLANMAGSLGAHVAFIVFPGTETGDHRSVDPTREGSFVVHVGAFEARYRLPLGSLLPPAMDEKTGESFPGNYRFSPFTGNKLSPAPAEGGKVPSDSPGAPSGSEKPPPPEKPAPAPAQP